MQRYDDWTESKPAEEDLVGVWTFTQASQRHLSNRGYSFSGQYRFIVKKGGILQIVRMPAWLALREDCPPQDQDSRAFVGTGTWEYSQDHYKTWQLRFRFSGKIGQGEQLQGGLQFGVRKQKAPYLLLTFIGGDPDQNIAPIFERISSGAELTEGE